MLPFDAFPTQPRCAHGSSVGQTALIPVANQPISDDVQMNTHALLAKRLHLHAKAARCLLPLQNLK